LKFLKGLHACLNIVRRAANMQVQIKNTHYNHCNQTNKHGYVVPFLLIIINVIHFLYCHSLFFLMSFAFSIVNSLDNLNNCIIYFSMVLFDFCFLNVHSVSKTQLKTSFVFSFSGNVH
jgi:hypothetical protein